MLLPVLFVVSFAACGARTEFATTSPDAASVPDVTRDVPPDLRTVDPDAGTPCGCPGTPSFRRCVLPLMCCPGLGRCEDPARFRCTGAGQLVCP